MMAHKAAFLDLNGTLVLPIKPDRLSDLRPISGAVESAARLTAAGFVCPVITVQSRIAKGLFTADEFAEWFDNFATDARQLGADLRGPYVCPHRYAQLCPCKKPNALLYERAMADLAINVNESVVIGDSPEDMEAAARIGATGCLVRTGWAGDSTVAALGAARASIVVPSIVEAVDWLLAPSRHIAD